MSNQPIINTKSSNNAGVPPAPSEARQQASSEKNQDELVGQYENKLEKVKANHTGWKGEDYIAYAEAELAAVKAGGMEGLKAFWQEREEQEAAEEGRKLPQQLTFDKFAAEAKITELFNHGRKAEVFFRDISLGFADALGTEGIRQVHRREINNALYANSAGAPEFLASHLPSQDALLEYPDLVALYPEAAALVQAVCVVADVIQDSSVNK